MVVVSQMSRLVSDRLPSGFSLAASFNLDRVWFYQPVQEHTEYPKRLAKDRFADATFCCHADAEERN